MGFNLRNVSLIAEATNGVRQPTAQRLLFLPPERRAFPAQGASAQRSPGSVQQEVAMQNRFRSFVADERGQVLRISTSR